MMASESDRTPSAAHTELREGSRVRNVNGALFEVTELEFDGAQAEVIDGGKSGGEGMVVWLDYRDFGPDGLEIVSDA